MVEYIEERQILLFIIHKRNINEINNMFFNNEEKQDIFYGCVFIIILQRKVKTRKENIVFIL